LHTYSDERQAVAKELIDFDREFSRMFSALGADGQAPDPAEFPRYFIAQGRFTAGVATRYARSMVIAEAKFQHLAEGFPVGMRFHSAPVVRLADAKPVHLGHVARADGAWRVYIFAEQNDPASPDSRARELCEFLASDASPIQRFTPESADRDSVIDVRAQFQQGHRELDVDEMPSVLLPRRAGSASSTTRRSSAPTRKPTTSSCEACIGRRAASSSCARTSTCHRCFRSTATKRWPTSSPRS
jgi:phenol 2-monooxygenase